MLLGAHQVLQGSLSLGVMLSLSALGAGFLEPIANLIGTAMRLTQLRGYMERIEDVLDAPRESPPARAGGSSRAADDRAAEVSVHGLSFAYPSEPRPVLTDIAFEVWPGECVAIVGASGSGKSTLARLLAGLYTPLAGSIGIDGRDLRAWDLHALRERFGIVTQETRLFSATLRDNVALFDPDVPEERIEQACRLACLHDTIMQMPMGYDTMLSDGGSSLSGGQRQRLSLARALLREPSLLILDEATSALDTATERNVQAQLRTLECTRIVVAHRLSTVVEADKIVVLDGGRVAGIGTHAQLSVRCAPYRELVRAQGDPPGARAAESEPASKAAPRPASKPASPLRAVPTFPLPSVPPRRSEPSAFPAVAASPTALAATLRAAARARTLAAGAKPVAPRRPTSPPARGRAE
jgi:ABC-type bacteriocin/lantibiotic exporter with double-glycine peptidase domain